MHAVVAEVLANSAAGVRGQELEGGGIGGGGSNHDGVLEGVTLSKEAHDVGDGGSLLTDGDVDAVEGLDEVTGLEGSLLVEDGINGDGSFSGLTITNNELTLATTDGHLKLLISKSLVTSYNNIQELMECWQGAAPSLFRSG